MKLLTLHRNVLTPLLGVAGLVWVVGCTGASGSQQSQTRPALGPPGGLRAVAAANLQIDAKGTLVADFGTVDPVEKPVAEVVVDLRNESDRPMTITRVDTSCSCTAGILGQGKGASLPLTLEPGKEIPLRAALSTLSLSAGLVRKSVRVYAQGITTPAIAVEVRAQVLETVIVKPRVLSLGQVPTGKGLEQTLTVEADTRWLPNGAVPKVNCQNGLVKLTPGTVRSTTGPGGKPFREASFKVEVAKDAPLGMLTGNVTVQVDIPAVPSVNTPPASKKPNAKVVSVPIAGEVVGPMRALPSIILMGAVDQGKEVEKSTTLVAVDAKVLETAKVLPGPGMFKASLSTTPPTNPVPVTPSMQPIDEQGNRKPGVLGQLIITLPKNAPTGYTRNLVTVQLASGKQLVIPVEVYVRPGAAPLPNTKP